MRKFFHRLRRFGTSESGPTAVEYAVLLALIIVICLASIRVLGRNAKASFRRTANSIAS